MKWNLTSPWFITHLASALGLCSFPCCCCDCDSCCDCALVSSLSSCHSSLVPVLSLCTSRCSSRGAQAPVVCARLCASRPDFWCNTRIKWVDYDLDLKLHLISESCLKLYCATETPQNSRKCSRVSFSKACVEQALCENQLPGCIRNFILFFFITCRQIYTVDVDADDLYT